MAEYLSKCFPKLPEVAIPGMGLGALLVLIIAFVLTLVLDKKE